MEKRIKFRLFYWFEETGDKDAAGNPILRERTGTFGQVVDIPRDVDVERGEALGAFFSDEESKGIEDGSYRGPAYDQLRTNAGLPTGPTGEGTVQPTDSEVPDIADMDSAEIAEIISSGGEGGKALNVNETIALARDDKDLAEKVLDAEVIASESDPRVGVEKGLEAIMSRDAS